jgi:hypothetical protein
LVRTKAPIWDGEYCLPTLSKDCRTSSLDPGVPIGPSDDLEGEGLHVLLDVGVLEASADESLGGGNSVLGVGHGLSLATETYLSLRGNAHNPATVLGEAHD